MTGRTLTLSALVALTQAKAIVTNHCPHDVYIWSVPVAGSSHTDNVPIKPGGRYEEPWRRGSAANPGIALKISPQANGINEGKDEINFAYSIDRSYQTKIWVDLSPVRGKAFDNNLSFHTCHGSYYTPDVQTYQCDAADEVELVLCDTARTTPAKDMTPFAQIQECYDYQHVDHQPDQVSPGCTPDCGEETDDDQPQCTSSCGRPSSSIASQPGVPACTQEPVPQSSEMPHPPAPKPTPLASSPFTSPQPSTGRPYTPAPPKPSPVTPVAPTSEHRYPPPRPTVDEPHYPSPEHTSEEQYRPPVQTSKVQHSAPLPTPTPPVEPHYLPPQPSQSDPKYPLPKPINEEPYHPPQQPEDPKPYHPPQKSEDPKPYHPPQQSEEPKPYHPPQQPEDPEPYHPPQQPEQSKPYQPAQQSDDPKPYQPPQQPEDPKPYHPPQQPEEEEPYHTPGKPTPGVSPQPQQPDEGKPYDPPAKPTHGVPPQSYQPAPQPDEDKPYHPPAKPTHGGPAETSASRFAPFPTRRPYTSPHKPASEEMYPPPSRPSYRARTINSKCPCQKPDYNPAPSPNHCLAKVVYPWRRATLLKDRNNTNVQAKPRSTVPLGAVLKREAAKREAATQTAKKDAVPSPLCSIVRKYHPEITHCDEQTMRLYAKDFYAQLCEPVYKDLMHGVDCNHVKKEVKTLYPDVDKSLTEKTCDSPLCALAHKYQMFDDCPGDEELELYARYIYIHLCEADYKDIVNGHDCNQVKKELKEVHPDVDTPVKAIARDHAAPPKPTRRVCIAPTCQAYKLSNKACEEAVSFLEQVSKDNGEKIDYTTDPGACGNADVAARNVTLPAVAESLLKKGTPESSMAARRQEQKMCIIPYCMDNNLSEEACDDAEDFLEQRAKDNGMEVDWTTDDEVCDMVTTVRTAVPTDVIKRNESAVGV
ncbi:hypothetical protein N0V83_004712 [Neocucurbitaria cava]|uniref:Uncharacterized protein n=1 Tax=Neocucurbitaria cava TaxID=798079 RepID=A0A9W8YA92_9PLEO|nr:hypothetical protein N0V83_004712 [Neocucurbitaria cava]